MLRKTTFLTVCFLLGLVLVVKAQSDTAPAWYLNLNGGISQMHGDVQTAENHLSKLNEETDLGLGLRFGYKLSPRISPFVQFNRHQFKGIKETSSLQFNAKLLEFQLAGKADVTNLLFGNGERRIGLYTFGGVSFLFFRSEVMRLPNGEIVGLAGYEDFNDKRKSQREVALGFPVGGGIDIRLNDRFLMNLETGLRITLSDMLDAYERGGKYDAFYYSSLGLTYEFNIKPFTPPPAKPGQKPEIPADIYADNFIHLDYDFPEKLNSLDEFEMRCTIHKGDIDGAGELTQILPIGFNVPDTAIGGARTEFKNYTLSLYWDELPSDSVFTIAYIVQLDKIYGNLPMTSILYFNKQGKEHRFKSDIFIKRKITAEPIVVVEEKPKKEDLKSPGEKVEFRLQVRASYKKRLSVDSLQQYFGIESPVIEEKVGNWYKYSVGSLKTYPDARNFRNEMIRQNKLKDAFIIAYYSGERLNTLSELKDLAPDVLPGATKYQESGICYRIQILALQERSVSVNVMQDMYQLDHEVNEEVYHNWRKYTVGKCLSIGSARSLLAELKTKGATGAFIVKYVNGERDILK